MKESLEKNHKNKLEAPKISIMRGAIDLYRLKGDVTFA